ncbi:MAG: flagellar basal body-associated FliL family protein [Desulfobacterales bacterium]|nr:MAG: flagellar basal body-associated FliL family protein [Desulfobacterales bacterium]
MSNKILIVLIGVLMVFMLGMGGGLFMMWTKLSELSVQSAANAGVNPDQANSIEQPLGPIYSLTTFIVNLADKGGNRYLRVTMDFELGNPELETELNKRLPQVRDSILMILPSKRFDDISSVEGKIALRDEILEKLNSLLTQGKITNIYFKEFVVQ